VKSWDSGVLKACGAGCPVPVSGLSFSASCNSGAKVHSAPQGRKWPLVGRPHLAQYLGDGANSSAISSPDDISSPEDMVCDYCTVLKQFLNIDCSI